ncbi:MAG: hypothetical protein NVS9B8_14570 [Candidatus Limnocylindrales bacterium]
MNDRTIMASRFKAECLTILDQVDELKISIVVTKHGRPVARVVPMEFGQSSDDLIGSVTLVAEDDEAYYSTGAAWDAEGRIR